MYAMYVHGVKVSGTRHLVHDHHVGYHTSSLPIMLSARHGFIDGLFWCGSQVNIKIDNVENIVPYDFYTPCDQSPTTSGHIEVMSQNQEMKLPICGMHYMFYYFCKLKTGTQ